MSAASSAIERSDTTHVTDLPAPSQARTLESLEHARKYRNWIFGLVAPHLGRRVLEIGSGTGTMTQCAADRELVVALELMPDFAGRLRQRFASSPSVVVLEGSANDERIMREAAGYEIDSAMSFNVLEHIIDDTEVMTSVHRMLPPGGRFAIFVPALPSLFGATDRALGHVRRYTRREAEQKLRRVGFDVADARYVNLPGAFFWFAAGRILRSPTIPGNSRALRLYDRTMVPLAQSMERHWRVPFGQSVLAIGIRR